jgi:hypothetical protein
MDPTKFGLGGAAVGWLLLACTRGGSEGQASPSRQGTDPLGSIAAFDAAPSPPAQVPLASMASPAAAAEVDKECRAICQRSVDLKCRRQSECMNNCVPAGLFTPCSASLQLMYRCLINEPLAHWECGDDGVAPIREGYCDGGQSQSLECMKAKMQR